MKNVILRIKKLFTLIISLLLASVFIVNTVGCSEDKKSEKNIDETTVAETASTEEKTQKQTLNQTEKQIDKQTNEQSNEEYVDLMNNVDRDLVEIDTTPFVYDEITVPLTNFSINLFKNSLNEGKNTVISPMSVALALAMTANGADGKTKEEMEKTLGGDLSITNLSQHLYFYMKTLSNSQKSKLSIANSIWFDGNNKGLDVNKNFLQRNADYFEAKIYKIPFDNKAVKPINNWVKKNTNGMIDKIINEISPDAVMYLINAIAFDAQWENVYEKCEISKDDFTNIDGVTKQVDMMYSDEYQYVHDNNAKGFKKDYYNGDYSFVALLPDKNIDIYDYINNLTGDTLVNILKNTEEKTIFSSLPKFKCKYSLNMNEALQNIGIKDAFVPGKADFSNITKSAGNNLFISNVFHKAFISVDERGTKAGAVTAVAAATGNMTKDYIVIKLNRPFIYMIIDNSYNLPVFMGIVTDI